MTGWFMHMEYVLWIAEPISDLEGMAAAEASIQEVEDLIEGLQPEAELHLLSPQHGVLGLHSKVVIGDGVQGREDLAVLLPQHAHLSSQTFEMLQLAHPRPPRRLPVRQHTLLLLLVHRRRLAGAWKQSR